MAVPFSIYMNPPYVLVSASIYGSGQQLSVISENVRIGVIEQINASTTLFSVGNTVFYKQEVFNTLLCTKDNSRYDMINETSIFFKEA